MKHPIKNSQGENTFQWRIFPEDVFNIDVYSQKDSDRRVSTGLEICNQNLQEQKAKLGAKEDKLKELETKYVTDIENLTEQNRRREEGIITEENKVVKIQNTDEHLDALKSKIQSQTVGSEGGKRKTKKHRKKRKSSRKKYTKRRKYSRRPRTR